MDAEDRAREEALARAQEEISRLRRKLADERFAEELKDALTLAAAAGEIASPVTHSRLLEMIVETAASVIPSRAASLFLIDEETEELIFEVALGPEAEEVRKFRIPLGQGIAGLVAVSGQPMAISDASSDPRQAADIAKRVGYEPESILCVPLIHNEVLSVCSSSWIGRVRPPTRLRTWLLQGSSPTRRRWLSSSPATSSASPRYSERCWARSAGCPSTRE